MKIACLCCTFNRPSLLEEIIESFNRQTFPADRRELIVLDDLAQYTKLDRSNLPDNVKIISVSPRFPTLGHKRNACASYASPDADVFSIWDDDDIYLPRHLEILSSCIASGAQWVGSKYVLNYDGRRKFVLETFRPRVYQGSWMYTRDLFERCGGYQHTCGTEDQLFWAQAHRLGVAITLQSVAITYIYRLNATNRICVVGCDSAGYAKLGQQDVQPVTRLNPRWSMDWEKFVNDTTAWS